MDRNFEIDADLLKNMTIPVSIMSRKDYQLISKMNTTLRAHLFKPVTDITVGAILLLLITTVVVLLSAGWSAREDTNKITLGLRPVVAPWRFLHGQTKYLDHIAVGPVGVFLFCGAFVLVGVGLYYEYTFVIYFLLTTFVIAATLSTAYVLRHGIDLIKKAANLTCEGSNPEYTLGNVTVRQSSILLMFPPVIAVIVWFDHHNSCWLTQDVFLLLICMTSISFSA